MNMDYIKDGGYEGILGASPYPTRETLIRNIEYCLNKIAEAPEFEHGLSWSDNIVHRCTLEELILALYHAQMELKSWNQNFYTRQYIKEYMKLLGNEEEKYIESSLVYENLRRIIGDEEIWVKNQHSMRPKR